ncbi:hypothetical protein [Halochromatium glycolicum]|jgi:hypothetical protein|uniref:hypothetical protein n=1 Tax=Halochromatium glycolicum TaxID=85075 RepID=UPI00190A758D|nr:hypothetical protein [Halochromatium glycolicum]
MSQANSPTTTRLDFMADDASEAGDAELLALIDRARAGDPAAAAECQRVMDAMNCGDESPVPTAY